MKITGLRVVHVRNHTDRHIKLNPTVTLISGANGSGKTSLIEAIYIALRGSSFRGSDKDVIHHTSEWCRIEVKSDDWARVVTFDSRTGLNKKQFTIDDKTNRSLLAKYRYPVVLFQPDDTRLIHGSPSRRRKYIDTVIAQFNGQYGALTRRYDRILQQRNKLLKRPDVSRDQLFSWDVSLSDVGAKIITARKQYIDTVNSHITKYYQSIAQDITQITAQYSDEGDVSQQILMNKLHHSFERDVILGSTSVGPHRHDFIVSINGKDAASVASRGETRTIILALKYIEIDTLREYTGYNPIVLLDDVFGELDTRRQKQLLTALTDSQVIITSTEQHSTATTITL